MPRGLLILLVLCVLGGVYQNWSGIQRWWSPPVPGSERVVLYATEWCGYCAKTRELFAKHGVDYVELDVERSEEGRRGHAGLGGGGVPVVVINDQTVIRGYRPDAILRALGRER